MSDQVGPGGGQVGPGGGQVGPSSSTPPSGVITLSGGVPTASLAQTRAIVGPGGGTVGPFGGLVGPGPGFTVVREPPSGVITLSGGVPGGLTPGGVIRIEGPNPDQAPIDDSWTRGTGNPIIEATEVWEGTQVRGPRVIQQGGFYRAWYSAGDSPEAIGYASCPDTEDPTDPLNWTKDPANPIIGDGNGGEAGGASLPTIVLRGGLYRLFYVDDLGHLMVTTSVDGRTGWTTPVVAIVNPKRGPVSLTVPPRGGWPDWFDPKTIEYNGITYVGYDIETNGNLEVKAYDYAAEAGGTPQLLHAAIETVPFDIIHCTPALLVRQTDNRLMAFYTAHAKSAMYLRISVNSLDTDPMLAGGFGPEIDLDSQIGGTQYTYPAPLQLTGEVNDPIYLLYREGTGSVGSLRYSVSTNGGATWSAGTLLYRNGTTTAPYWKIVDNGVDRFDIIASSDHPAAAGPVKLFHFYWTAGSFHKSDGTVISGLPFDTTDLTQVYDGSAGNARAEDIAYLVGEPVVLFQTFTSPDARWGRWTGAAWDLHTVIANPGLGMCLDHDNPNALFIPLNVGSDPEIFRYETADAGTSWSTERLTFSTDDKLSPTFVRGSASGPSVLWLQGVASDDLTSYSLGVMGHRPGALAIPEWGSRDMWFEDGFWKMLISGTNPFGRWHIFYAESAVGFDWTLERGGSHYGTLQVAADGATAGPRVRIVDNLYHLWFHAAPAAGNLPTDIYHSTSADVTADAWTTPTLVFEHSGTGFEVLQVADPDVLIPTGDAVGLAFLFFEGVGSGAIGVAVAFATGGITTEVPGQVTSTIHLPFDVGAPTSTIRLLFDILGPPVTSTIHLPFTLRGAIRSTIHLPFDILGPLTSTIRLPFDLLSVPRVNEVQVIVSGGIVTSYVLTFDGQPTGSILGTANAATVQAALEALSNLAPGDVTVTGGPLNTTDFVITFGGAYAGLDVPQITVVATGIVDLPPVGTTTQNGGPVSTGGTTVRGIPQLWHPMMVFDKAGTYLGSISQFNVINPPVRYLRSRRVQNEGGMTFAVSRHSSDFGLIASDRLVRLQSLRGEQPWWGTISPQADASGVEEITCKDGFTLLRDGLAITIPPAGSTDDSEEVNDGTPATAIYAKIMALHNDLRALTGEVQWELDLQGSKPFRGDLTIDADTLTALDMIVGRSRTEYVLDSRLDGNRLVPILRERDSFDAGAGADIHDGPDGNVTAGATVITDPTPLVFSLRLNGLQTNLAKCLPEWARWALLDVTPTITASVDPGAFRNRQVTDESVDWGLSHAAVNAQCNAILDWLWGLYRTYLMALHDIEGRPNHEGWAFNGPPDLYEPQSAGKDSLSRRAWRTRLQLVELRTDEPASAVMISESHSQINLREWLVVRYNRVTGVQTVTVWAIETAAGLELIKWNLTGSATLYHVSGDRVVSRSTITTTGAFVDPYNTRIYDPVARRYRWLRRIINGPFALAYYIDPADADNAFVDLGVDAALSTTSGDGTSLISKMYDFERFAIEDWDPRRDGIGARLARPTIFFGSPTTRPRWHVVSFDVGGDASTALTHGIGATSPGTSMAIEVDSNFGFPDPDLEPGSFPFMATIDDGMDQEQILVLSMFGTEWTVLRGQGGTDAIIHEAGAPVKMFGAAVWGGCPFPYSWPEGQQWAEEEIAELSKQRIQVNVHIAHFRDDQLTIDYGSTHAIDVATEGPPGRWTGSGRVIGWSTDPGYSPDADDPTPPGGETELVLEWVQ